MLFFINSTNTALDLNQNRSKIYEEEREKY